jgi:transposase
MPAVKRLGRPRETDLRTIVDAILYIARTGCQWRLLPKDFRKRSVRSACR